MTGDGDLWGLFMGWEHRGWRRAERWLSELGLLERLCGRSVAREPEAETFRMLQLTV